MKIINGFEIDKYNVHEIKDGAKTSTCPECSENRKKKTEKCMSVFWDTGLGQCNHCGARVQLHTYKKRENLKKYVRPNEEVKSVYSEKFLKYAKEHRNISENTLKLLKISEGFEWMPKAKADVHVIKFNYFLDNELINIKYRAKNKDFKLYKDAEKILYNIDAIRTSKQCVIVEGEWDVCSYVEAGIFETVSVPNGFTDKGIPNLDYLDNYYQYFENKDKIFLAVDNDIAGVNGRNELIRRLGTEKCFLVDFKDCKDADEYSNKYGYLELQETLINAQPLPLEYVETLKDFEQDLDDFYLNGSPKGFTTGMNYLDEAYSFEMGQYTVITGAPQSGKSEFLDAMCVKYAIRYKFKVAFASPENKPNKFHADKLLRKIAGFKPKTRTDLDSFNFIQAKDFLQSYFNFVEFNDGFDLTKVLNKFAELVKRKGVRIFVLDPFNKIRFKEYLNKNINDYTSAYMNEIDMFCKKHQCHIFLVAHPIKMQKEEKTNTYKMPTAYDIKGGGEIFDMSYHILALVKDLEKKCVTVKTLKVKFQHLGSADKEFHFAWNINNGRYECVDIDENTKIRIEPKWDNKNWLNQPLEIPKELKFEEIEFDDLEIDENPPF